jgi:hypothetical protein
MPLGITLFSTPAGVSFPQIPVVVNHPAIPSAKIKLPEQAKEEFRITNANNKINTKIERMLQTSKAWTFQMSNANKPVYRDNQPAKAVDSQLGTYHSTQQRN